MGNDPEAARLVGIRVDRVLLSVYTVAGLIYGITAWVQIGRAGTASANAIVDANLDSITAVVIGGTSLFGGRGAIVGTILGALIVGVFRTGLSLAGVDDQWRVLAHRRTRHRRRLHRPVDQEGQSMSNLQPASSRPRSRAPLASGPRWSSPTRRTRCFRAGSGQDFGKVVGLDGVNLDLFPGEILSVIGDNGAGKSTLIKA